MKKFLYEKSSTRKPNRKKTDGAFKMWRQKKFKLTSGAPFARCATSNRKKIGVEIFLEFFSKYDT